MKRFYSILVALCTFGMCAAQMQKGESLINVGIGLAPGVGVNASYDYGLIDTWGPGLFTVGGFAGFQTEEKPLAGLDDYNENRTGFAVRATYRYPVDAKFEVYGAAITGFFIHSYSKHYKSKTRSLWGTYAGCRYSFSPNVSVFAEVGWGLYALNGGLCFSF